MTAPAPPGPLPRTLALVDVSRARTQVLEDAYVAEIDAVYAAALAAWKPSPRPEPSDGSDDGSALLTAALLAALVAILRRAHAAGVAEGVAFARQQVESVGGSPPLPVPPESFLDLLVADFIRGQAESSVATGPVSSRAQASQLADGLRSRARLAAVVAVHAGRSAAVLASIEQAAGDVEARTGSRVHKMWVARFDQDTPPCKLCVRLHGIHVPLGADFPVLSKEPPPYGGILNAPPRHPQCVVGATRVSVPRVVSGKVTRELSTSDVSLDSVVCVEGDLTAAATSTESFRDVVGRSVRSVTERDYVGDVITVEVALGYKLTATPNHPIATRRGWIPVSELREGDYVLCSVLGQWNADGGSNPDVEDVPPTIQEISQSMSVSLGPVPTSAEAFHGDGVGSDVHIVRSNRFLGNQGQFLCAEHGEEFDLVGRGVASSVLDAESASPGFVTPHSASTSCDVSSTGVSSALLRAGAGHAEEIGGAAAAGFEAVFSKNSGDETAGNLEQLTQCEHAFATEKSFTNDVTVNTRSLFSNRDILPDQVVSDSSDADTEVLRQLIEADSSQVTFSEIVSIQSEWASTHVYNLESSEGWFAANGIITHNCRCSLVLFLPDVAEPNVTPRTMTAYADNVLATHLLDGHDYVAATVVYVKPYTRVRDGKTQQVAGYYYDIESGQKVAAPSNPSAVPDVSKARAGAMRKETGRAKAKEETTDGKFGPGTYDVTLPDGSTTRIVVGKDGSSTATHGDQTEASPPDKTSQFLLYWDGQGAVTRVEDAEGKPLGLVDLAGTSATLEQVQQAITLLEAESSTSVKGPLKKAGSPLAGADLVGLANDVAGAKVHYGKLKPAVVRILQDVLNKH